MARGSEKKRPFVGKLFKHGIIAETQMKWENIQNSHRSVRRHFRPGEISQLEILDAQVYAKWMKNST